jgi:plasmid stabilization system protein ParE
MAENASGVNISPHILFLTLEKLDEKALHYCHRRRSGRHGTMSAFPGFSGPRSRQAAGQAIARQFRLLETVPNIGCPHPELPSLRELVITFEDSGYVALYHHEPADDAVYVLAFRHQKEKIGNPHGSG